MPRISEFYGIVIFMYWKDHGPPHVHAFYSGQEALIQIDDGTILKGSIPRTAARLAREWVELRREELAQDWNRAQVPEPLLPIEGLQ